MSGEAVRRLAQQEELIKLLHRKLSLQYPALSMRWSRIYGSRWAHFLGGSTDVSFFQVKLALNEDFGLCIDNPQILAHTDLERITAQIKGELSK